MSPDTSASPEKAALVLAHLRRVSHYGEAQASGRGLADDLGISREVARRSLNRLLEQGTIEVARKGTGCGYPTTYRVT